MTAPISHLSKKIVILIIATALLQCASHLASRDPEIIEVEHHNIWLKPIKGLQQLESNELWPENKSQGNYLLENIHQIWKHLLSEFRRCEKYGLYTMVDSTVSSTVHITPEIITMKVKNDTLHIPIIIKTFYTAEKRSTSLTINAYGIYPSDTVDTASFQRLSIALADYRREFPYREIVSLFYLQGQKE